jgi:hypothetical protein
MQNIKFFMDIFNPTQNTNFFFVLVGVSTGSQSVWVFFSFEGKIQNRE